MPAPVFIKLGIYLVYHGIGAHLNGVLHKSLPSACVSVCVSLPSLQANGSINTFPRQRIYETTEHAIFYAVCALPNDSLSLYHLSLPGSNSAKTFPRQQGIVGGVVFYAILVVGKKSRRLVLPRTSF
jgi:hypothetical protein